MGYLARRVPATGWRAGQGAQGKEVYARQQFVNSITLYAAGTWESSAYAGEVRAVLCGREGLKGSSCMMPLAGTARLNVCS